MLQKIFRNFDAPFAKQEKVADYLTPDSEQTVKIPFRSQLNNEI